MLSDGIIARVLELVAIDEVSLWLAGAPDSFAPFGERERAYAFSKPDPARRLAARLAAKRAGRAALDPALTLDDFEVMPARGGPPRLRLSEPATRRARERGVGRVLLSLTHGLTHAAALVLLVNDGGRGQQ
jgi:phosphopantetheinyl transferase (holo-ACP synthase)